MPKKFGQNQKAIAGRERKEAAKEEKRRKEQAALEAKEAAEWSKGAKRPGKKEQLEEKRAQQQAKKAELAALLANEEKELAKMKKPSAAQKKALQKDAQYQARNVKKMQDAGKSEIPVLSADNLDDALDLLSITTGKPTKPGSRDAPDRHPERRAKAAFAAFSERELPRLKQENPGLRQSQLKQLLWKQWQKSPENPFNQATIAYNATREEELAKIQEERQKIEERLRVD